MRKKMLVSLCLVAAALITLGAADSCTAPMDATGDYSGTWSFEVTEGEGEEATKRTVVCESLSLRLEQDVNLDYPENLKVTGTVFIDSYSCLEDANWPENLPFPKPGEWEVTGTMGVDNNRITLITGGLGPGTGLIFGMDGVGESVEPNGDTIPEMISYAGKWGFALGVVFIGSGGFGGEFAVERDE